MIYDQKYFLYAFLFIILTVAGIIDLRIQKIPNRLTYTVTVLSLVFYYSTGGSSGFFFSLSGVLLGTGIFLIPYLTGGMGAGDVKLMGAVGAVLGPAAVFLSILYTFLVGGIYALGIISIRHIQLKLFHLQAATSKKLPNLATIVPTTRPTGGVQLCYGVAIALGTFIYMGLEISNFGQLI